MEQFSFETYDFKRSLILVGAPGVGKSYQAMQLYNRFPTEKQFDKYWITDGMFKQKTQSQDLNLRKAIDWQTSLEFYPMEIMIRCPFLIYDDLWVSDDTKAYMKNLTFLLDERIRRGLPTIFTTNLTNKEIADKLDERIASRVLLNTDVIQMTGEDLRKKSARVFEFKVKKEEK